MDSTGALLGGPDPGTDYCYKFSIWNATTGGSKIWPAGDPSTDTITTREGVFDATIGEADALTLTFTDNQAFVEVKVATISGPTCDPGDGAESFQTLSPRPQIVSSGFAINSRTVGGFTPEQSATDNQIPVLTTGALILGHATLAGLTSVGAYPLAVDAGTTGALNLNNTSSGDILLGGGSASTGCTLTNSTGAFACTAGLTASSLQIDSATTGVNIDTDGDGAITFLGTSDGFDESLTFNFDDTENTVVLSTSSGVTAIDYGSLNITGLGTNLTATAGLTVGTGSNGALTLAPNGTGDLVFNPDANTNLQITANGVPADDMVAITNSGQAIATAGVEGLSINYTGGAAAVESSGAKIDLTPGTTAEGTWNGLKITMNATGSVAKVVENGIKLEGPTAISDGGIANAIDIANSKWTTAININEAKVALSSPFGGLGKYENYLKRSEQFDQTDGWTVETSGVTVAANNTAAPDGTTTAEKLTDNATAGTRISQSATASNSETWTFSVWIKNSNATGTFEIELHDNSLAGASDTKSITVASPDTDNWRRYSITHATAGAGVTSIVAAIDVNQADAGTAIFVWGAQLEKQVSPGVYHRTIGTAFAYPGSEGLVVNSNLNNSTASGLTYGSRFINYLISGTAGQHDGVFIRNQDDTSLTGSTHVVRGLQVQSWNGSNTNGTNIGIDAYGKTFGIAGTIDALAGAQSVPAAVFAYLQNTSATSTGNAIRAYSDKATGATLVSIFHQTSAFTGTGLMMDIGNSGSFASGNFLSLKNAGSQKMHVDSGGITYITTTSANSRGLCHSSANGATDEAITDCSSNPIADYAERYPVEAGVTFGDLVSLGTQDVITNDGGLVIKQLIKTTQAYDKNVIGVVSNNDSDFSSTGYNIDDIDNPMSVALSGRVPVKFSDENGEVEPGDFLAASGSIPGAAMKATQPGWIIGQAINDPQDGQVMAFVRGFYYDPTLTVDENNNVTVQSSENGTAETAPTAAAYLINQEGSGDILQLQNNGTDRFLVKNNGAININVALVEDTEDLVVINSNDSEIFSINAFGQAAFSGNIIVRDDSFAGSITTDEDGEALITFTYDLGTGKPDVQLTVEGDIPALAQISEWVKDIDENYIGFKIKSFNLSSELAPSVTVHYLVVGKQDGYQTDGVVIEVVEEPAPTREPPASESVPEPVSEPTLETTPDGTEPALEPQPEAGQPPAETPVPEPTPEPELTPTPESETTLESEPEPISTPEPVPEPSSE